METREFKKEMIRINNLFAKIEDIFDSLPVNVQDACYNMHNEGASINHCIRWGTQAAEELIECASQVIKKSEE